MMGMVDMENCVLYRSLDDLQAKLAVLRRDSGLADRIAAAGQALAERDFGYDKVARDFLAALEPPLRKPLVSRRLLRKQYGYQEP